MSSLNSLNSRKTRLLYFPAAAALMAVLAFAAPQPSTGQSVPARAVDLEELANALTQQTALMANHQAEMDARVDRIAEAVRQARIYAARGGAQGKK